MARGHSQPEVCLGIKTDKAFDLDQVIVLKNAGPGKDDNSIAWALADSSGNKFLRTVPKAAINAAHPPSSSVPSVQSNETDIRKLAVGTDPSAEQIEKRARDLEKDKGRTGTQLIGFTRAADGTVSALIRKGN